MNEEIMNREGNEEIEVYNEPDEPETSGGILGKALIAIAGIGVGAIVLARANKDKLEQRRIRKLEKAGYRVTKIENAPADFQQPVTDQTNDCSEKDSE